jgi:hypothetical protein
MSTKMPERILSTSFLENVSAAGDKVSPDWRGAVWTRGCMLWEGGRMLLGMVHIQDIIIGCGGDEKVSPV